MSPTYDDILTEATDRLVHALLEREDDLPDQAQYLDKRVQRLLQDLGKRVMIALLQALVVAVLVPHKARGLTVHRKRQITVDTLYGPVELDSPYLRHTTTRKTARPVAQQLKFTHRCKTPALQRALSDFGSEESFEHAANRFEEHYGWRLKRDAVRRVTLKTAQAALAFIQRRFDATTYGPPTPERPGVAELLVELDGCEIRTGTLVAREDGAVTAVRGLPTKKRVENWREVRVGFARELHSRERTYIARMDKYPVVIDDLVGAALDRGLTTETEVVSVSDGGIGLKERLEKRFPGLFFILDYPHLSGNFYEAAAEMERASGPERHQWVKPLLRAVSSGRAASVIQGLRAYSGTGESRVHQLAGYIERFQENVHYDHIRDCGWPVGSGEIESAHRYIPQKRLKLPGAWWLPSTLNPMLALRVVRANGWWEDFWNEQNQAVAAS